MVHRMVDGYMELMLTDNGRDFFLPTSDSARRLAELAFLGSPPAFDFIIRTFDGGVLPQPQHLGNLLGRQFKIGPGWSLRVAQIFTTSAGDLNVIDQAGCLRYDANKHQAGGANGFRPSGTSSPTPEAPMTIDTTAQDAATFTSAAPPLPAARGANSVWVFGGIRLETPDTLSHATWVRLRKYVEIIEPEEPA